jgi:uncharacterized protein YgiM (DUF1202 family)
MSNLILASPFLALLFGLYALIQTARKRERLGVPGILLAGATVLVPVAALALDSASDPPLSTLIVANAGAVLVISGVILVWDYRSPARTLAQSFGTLGLGLSVLLFVSLYSTPLILSQLPVADTIDTTSANPASDTANVDLVPVVFNADQQADTSSQVSQQPQPPANQLDTTALQALLQAETGLTSENLLTELNAGATLAELVAAANGDLATVTSALTETLEEAIASESLPARLLDQLGTDAATIARNVLNGQAPAMFLNMLLGGTSGGPPSGAGAPGSASDSGLPATNAQAQPPTDGTNPEAAAQPRLEPTATPALEPTTVILPATVESTKLPTPTPFLFDVEPTATPVPVEPTAVPTCALTTQFNLNLRSGPSTDAEWILTIPAFTTVPSTGHNTEGWWQVTYEEATGWVSGEYLTADRSCSALPVIE